MGSFVEIFILPFMVSFSEIKHLIPAFALLIPNIIDFYFTFLDYIILDSETSISSYFIIRFIYQGCVLIFVLHLCSLLMPI